MQVDDFLKKILALTSLTNLCQDHWHESGHCVALYKFYTVTSDASTTHGKVFRVADSKEGSYDPNDPYAEVSLSMTSAAEYNPIVYSHKIMEALVVQSPGENSLIGSSNPDFVAPHITTLDPATHTDDPCFLEFDVTFCVMSTGINIYDPSMGQFFFPHGLDPPGDVLAFDPCDVSIVYINSITHELKKVHLYDNQNVRAAGILRDWAPTICTIGVKGISTGPISFQTFSKVLSHDNAETKFVEVELCEYSCSSFFKQTLNIVLLVFSIVLFVVDLVVLGLFLWFCVIRRILKRRKEKATKKKGDKDEITETMTAATNVGTTNVGTTVVPTAVEGASPTATPEAGTPSTKNPADGFTSFATTNDMTHMKMTLDL